MGFLISEYIVPFRGGDGGGGTYVPTPLPLAVTIYPVAPIIDPQDPTPVVWNSVNIPPQYRTAKLLYFVYRNGVEQIPGIDFSVVGTWLVFVRPFADSDIIRLYGYGFSA